MKIVLVELPDGSMVEKRRIDVAPGERVLVGGPAEFALSSRMQRMLEDEIKASGGIHAWRAGARPPKPPVPWRVVVSDEGPPVTFTFTLAG